MIDFTMISPPMTSRLTVAHVFEAESLNCKVCNCRYDEVVTGLAPEYCYVMECDDPAKYTRTDAITPQQAAKALYDAYPRARDLPDKAYRNAGAGNFFTALRAIAEQGNKT